MNKSEWASYKAALRTLSKGPEKIKAAKSEYAAADAWMKDPAHRRTWSEEGQKNFYGAAREKRDTVIKGECAKMAAALATVRSLNDFPRESIDLGSVKLQNALNIVQMMGKRLPPAQQLSILESFRGQPAALTFLGDVYEQTGLYYADYARDMAKPISSEALENMEYAIAKAEYTGEWDEGRIYWTRHAFDEQEKRLGFDANDADPFVTALKAMRPGETVDNQRLISNTIMQMTNDFNMTDTEKTRLFDEVTAKMEAASAAAEEKEIKRQASTAAAIEDRIAALEADLAGRDSVTAYEGGNVDGE